MSHKFTKVGGSTRVFHTNDAGMGAGFSAASAAAREIMSPGSPLLFVMTTCGDDLEDGDDLADGARGEAALAADDFGEALAGEAARFPLGDAARLPLGDARGGIPVWCE